MDYDPFSILKFLSFMLIIIYGERFELLIFSYLIIYRKWEAIQTFAHNSLNPATTLIFGLALTCFYILLQLVALIRGLQRSSSSADGFPIKPMFFPCATKHVRMFPAMHGFSYSYLLTGVPIGFKGSAGGMISVDETHLKTSWYIRLLTPWSSWYLVSGDNYLGRGHHPEGLAGKLRNYLESENIEPSQYPHVYLFTAARFLNYASNPVSFWLLYSREKELAAMILEVNNTFDERHSYFLKLATTETSSTTRYSGKWPKDFYVSTFNSRAGTYSVSSSTSPLDHDKIDTTLNLSDASGKGMLIARVYSTSQPLDPTTMTLWEKINFLASWWWVGLATFPRTVVQALNLFVHKRLPWVSRPEPRKDTMSRRADEIEVSSERVFRIYLKDQLERCKEPVKITYIPAGLVGTESQPKVFESRSETPDKQVLEARVLTPLFYSRLVQYSSITEALTSEISNGTISISGPSLLQNILKKSSPITNPKSPKTSTSSVSPWNTLKFALISLLRNRSSPPAIPKLADELVSSSPPPQTVKSRHGTSTSELDDFVRQSLCITPSQQRDYASAVLRLLLANRIALGWLEILDLEISILKATAIWWTVGVVA